MWRVLEWSTEAARGAIGSPHFPRVEFDAAIADVDDFEVGEEVFGERARGYLATRLELDSTDLAVEVIDDEERFGYVVCRRLAVEGIDAARVRRVR